jgi:hypothetical protein
MKLYRNAANIAPQKHATRYIHTVQIDIPHLIKSNSCGPTATAGLNAHPDIPPTA